MKSEHKRISSIVKKIRSCNYTFIDEAIQDLIDLNSSKAFKRLLNNTLIDKKGVLWVNPKFVVTGPKQPAMDYAFWEIIGNSPNKILLANGIYRSRTKTIRIKRHKSIHHWTHGMDKFPEGILNFKNLQRLYLGDCNVDIIPDGICKLSNLKELTCSSSHLKNLPTSIGKLEKLISLDLEYCSLQKLPDSFVNLKLLTILNLSGNSLKKLPHNFENISLLKELYLSGNSLKSIPKSIDKLISLEHLDLSWNQIVNLKYIFSLIALKNLNISSNKIKKLPHEIEKLQCLQSLEFNYNEDYIEMDSGLSKLNNLSYMSFFGSEATPRLTRKEFKNRNDINQYFKKIRRYHKEPNDDLIYVKPTPYSWNSYSNNSKKSRYKKDIQNQIDFVTELLSSRDNNNFTAGINILENIDDINVFIGSTKNIIYIDSNGCLVCNYDKYNKLAFIKLLNLYKRRNLDFKNFKIDRIKQLSIDVPKKKDELFDELLIFENLTKLKLFDIDSSDCFNFDIFSQIENLTISSSTFFDFNISNDLFPKLKSIGFNSCEIDKITFTSCENLISICSTGRGYYSERSVIKYFKVVNCPKLNEIQLLTSYRDLSYFEITNTPNMNFLNLYANLDLCKLEINSTQHLKKIILRDCSLTSLPQFVNESKLCEFLDLEDNKLNEKSIDFKGLTNLLYLNLNKNKFTTVPSSIYDLKKLKSLTISGQIKTIDQKIRNLKQLKVIHLGWNDNTLRKHYFLLKNLKDIW
tara:strand:- start:605 stop:2842 length:2238 start_codon:yes stop_codon:yes gene_type:complete